MVVRYIYWFEMLWVLRPGGREDTQLPLFYEVSA